MNKFHKINSWGLEDSLSESPCHTKMRSCLQINIPTKSEFRVINHNPSTVRMETARSLVLMASQFYRTGKIQNLSKRPYFQRGKLRNDIHG